MLSLLGQLVGCSAARLRLWSAPRLSADTAGARHLRAVCVPGSRAEQVPTAAVARQGSCPVCPSVCLSPCLWLLLRGGLGGVGGEGGRCLSWQLRVPAVRVLRGPFLAQPECLLRTLPVVSCFSAYDQQGPGFLGGHTLYFGGGGRVVIMF